MHEFWYIVIATFWTGFFVLEGFDFGVGMLHMVVGKTETERRVAINSIGPFWDGNEVWLIVAGAGTFAAFPGWYATMFSALYLGLMLLLVALIIRGVSFEWRSKRSPQWANAFSWTLTIGSILIPFVIGIGLGDLLAGLPIDANGEYTGTFWDIFTPFGVFLGVTLTVLSLVHGATFLALKTTGIVQQRAAKLAHLLSYLGFAVIVGLTIWTQASYANGVIPNLGLIIGIGAMITTILAARAKMEGWAFAGTAIALLATVSSLFIHLHPNVMVSSTNEAYNLTIDSTASGAYALKVMTVVALVFTPLVLAYQGWTYWVFRARVKGPRVSGEPTTETQPTH